jgi:hypothetical protein
MKLVLSIVSAEGLWKTWAERFQYASSSRSELTAKVSYDQLPGLPSYYDYAGASHVHSSHSDGAGSVQEIAAAASQAGLDFVLVTDHNALTAQQLGEDRWYLNGKVLIIVGTEFATDIGYLLAFDAPDDFAPFFGSAEEGQAKIKNSGAYGYIALPCDLKGPWRDPERRAPWIGLEVFNLSCIARTKINLPGFLLAMLRYFGRNPGSVFSLVASRPDEEMRLWDHMLQRAAERDEVMPLALGSLDAHAMMKVAGQSYPYPTYEEVFRTLRTHVLTQIPLSNQQSNCAQDQRILHDSLRSGLSYISYDNYEDATGFEFCLHRAGEMVAQMGDVRVLSSDYDIVPNVLTVRAPRSRSIIRLYRDGKLVASVRGGRLDHAVFENGTYRVEVYLYRYRLQNLCYGAKPWIFSNPIRIKIPVGNESPVVDKSIGSEASRLGQG